MNAWFTVSVVRLLGVGALGAAISAAATTILLSAGWRPLAVTFGAAFFPTVDLLLLPSRIRRHRNQGRMAQAAGELALLSHIAPATHMRVRARLGLASVLLATGQAEKGAALLRTIPRASLPAPLKATWDANHAYYLLETHKDPAQAFGIADQLADRPDPGCPPAFRPIRGLALLAMGRTKEAISELTGALFSRKLGSWERAETNYHLAQAWKSLGHPAYAADHLFRTCNSCTASPYAERASRELASNRGSASS